MNKEEIVEMISQLNRLIKQVNTLNGKCPDTMAYPPVKFELQEAQDRLEMCRTFLKRELKENVCSNISIKWISKGEGRNR